MGHNDQRERARTPMTYQGKDGRQYIVIAAGGGGFFGSDPSDAIEASLCHCLRPRRLTPALSVANE
jgi:hypothetical protein